MATFSIQIWNNTSKPQSYLLFQSAPQVSLGAEVFSNVFQKSVLIPSLAQVTFTMTKELWAFNGTSTGDIQAGVVITSSQTEKVTLSTQGTPGTQLIMDVTGNISPAFELPPGTQSDLPGTFEIVCTDWTPQPGNSIFIGMAAKNNTGNIVPVATVGADPNSKFYFNPVTKYYISTGSYTPGQIVNIEELGQVQLCDFTTGPNTQVYTQQPNLIYVSGKDIPTAVNSAINTGPAGITA